MEDTIPDASNNYDSNRKLITVVYMNCILKIALFFGPSICLGDSLDVNKHITFSEYFYP